ncbi:galactose mutarotase-like enzyme [Streptococcus rupicaprae]|uniref:Galactose mutarotase-like enzyme n=2 Tax=Streptococcus rupicaprae TaxID=759619 RepID=A0ABV2FGC5_9STRE
MMVIQLKNSELTVEFSILGGSLSSIKDKDGVEYLWQGDATYWSGQAPVLFPICGSLRNDRAIYSENEVGFMPRHGLVRKCEFELVDHSENQVTFAIQATDEMLAQYPYRFELRITYTLFGKTIRTTYQVINHETEKELPYFIGGHPGFNCPLLDGEAYEDYYLEFETAETCTVPRSFPETGLLDVNDRTPFLNGQKILDLDYDLFSHDAITLDQLTSRSVSLKSKKSHKGLRVDFADFSNLIIWSTTNKGPFIALEPWSGLSTSLEEGDHFHQKRQLEIVEPSQTSSKEFDITIL